MSKYNQLDLLSQFDRSDAREDRLVEDLVTNLRNIKFLRTNLRFTGVENKENIDEILSQILYWMAWITHRKARFVEKYRKHRDLEYFLDMTREKRVLSVSEPFTIEVMVEYLQNQNVRLRSIFTVNKDLLIGELSAVKRVLNYFNEIQDAI